MLIEIREKVASVSRSKDRNVSGRVNYLKDEYLRADGEKYSNFLDV